MSVDTVNGVDDASSGSDWFGDIEPSLFTIRANSATLRGRAAPSPASSSVLGRYV
jgi:hypothetical protein